MELGAVFSTSQGTIGGPPVGPGSPFAAWAEDAGKTLTVLERAGFTYIAVTHADQSSWTHPIVLLSRVAAMSGRLMSWVLLSVTKKGKRSRALRRGRRHSMPAASSAWRAAVRNMQGFSSSSKGRSAPASSASKS